MHLKILFENVQDGYPDSVHVFAGVQGGKLSSVGVFLPVQGVNPDFIH